MLAIESALVVLVPEAEVVVKPFRDKYDPSAAHGCPAHVTLLYPFKLPDEITKVDFDNLSRCFAIFQPFQFSLVVTRSFPGVLYFVPQPDQPFRRLTYANLGVLSGNTALWGKVSRRGSSPIGSRPTCRRTTRPHRRRA